ncbi:serine hydrolase domain-containing protein [uncultured Bradyrhizobium sp.]|mgnify:CR=1 FL=1|jgi:CubicO group peptidase (beta-lactamase class C family)|uniref:serine hydrolase domain-containing protein n=1 Tax=uncultured Bradyrhizobium sp. TaxID=199684 RepID=UPI00260619E7|nr:serine hydrolase domain-containing protein [uncultured Bradyrhizobium sp.]
MWPFVRLSRRTMLARSAAVTLAAAAPALSHQAKSETDDRKARLDRVIDRAIGARRIVGSVVLVMQDGETIYRRAAGFADREAAVPMREDAMFRLASLSKPIVSVAAMALVERGGLDPQDPVTKWLPDFHPQTADGKIGAITIHHLLTHTAGLSYGFLQPPDSPYQRAGISDGLDRSDITLDEEIRRIAAAPLLYEPGARWGYSLATDVLGAVIAKATGEPLPDAVRRLVMRPLAMGDTSFVVEDGARLAVPYVDGKPEPARMTDPQLVPFRGAGIIHASPSRALDHQAFASGGAGLVSTAGDYARLAEALRRGGAPVLKAPTVQRMMTSQIGDLSPTGLPAWGFGYGAFVLRDSVAAKSPQGTGTWTFNCAYGQSFFVDPVAKLTVIAFTNTGLEGGFGAFPIEIRDAVYGRGD